MVPRKLGLLFSATALFVVLQLTAASACVTPKGCDRMTGGGQVIAMSGQAGTFSVEGGVLHGDFWGGHSTFLDHGTGFFMRGNGVVTNYTTSFIGPTYRVIYGTADVRISALAPILPGYTYRIVVADNAEPGPGAGVDSYALQVYKNGRVIYATRQLYQRILRGKLQLHIQMNCAADVH